ncbi:MAG: hypothetical protein EPN56_03395 [Rhodanobacter sp.]|nr:MAG: hypothetical protein EPN78_11920 [Rhodanobacter sp.]TAM14035.1 MAG: hypothetical protein EPN66_02905 [Rhodanobacter sp.]TAM37025.1 MAG: hypothetical protein EPN56_03395 [Rhodanobacter sp.]
MQAHFQMSVELYYNPWCTACGGGNEVKAGYSAARWIDATRHLETAASLRITCLPALVVDGKLVAQGPRALERLRAWAIKGVDAR